MLDRHAIDGPFLDGQLVSGTRLVEADGQTVVVVHGEIDLATCDRLWSVVEAACARSRRVVIDLRETTFMDSTGLGVLMRAHRALSASNDVLTVRTVAGSTVRRILEVSGVDRIVKVET